MNTTKATELFTARRTWAILLAAGITFAGFTMVPIMAQAADASDDVPQVVVHFADLNLSHEEGISVLYRRIQSAAVQVCGSVEPRNLTLAASAKACRDQAISRAVTAVNNPMLTSEYLAKTGHPQNTQNLEAKR
jgi:UrcA family protein